jgi:hypothetical protein
MKCIRVDLASASKSVDCLFTMAGLILTLPQP